MELGCGGFCLRDLADSIGSESSGNSMGLEGLEKMGGRIWRIRKVWSLSDMGWIVLFGKNWQIRLVMMAG